jgi:hypothetical protein
VFRKCNDFFGLCALPNVEQASPKCTAWFFGHAITAHTWTNRRASRQTLPSHTIADVEIRQEQMSIRVLEGERIGSETTSQHSDAYSAAVIRLTTGMGITIVSGR